MRCWPLWGSYQSEELSIKCGSIWGEKTSISLQTAKECRVSRFFLLPLNSVQSMAACRHEPDRYIFLYDYQENMNKNITKTQMTKWNYNWKINVKWRPNKISLHSIRTLFWVNFLHNWDENIARISKMFLKSLLAQSKILWKESLISGKSTNPTEITMPQFYVHYYLFSCVPVQSLDSMVKYFSLTI